MMSRQGIIIVLAVIFLGVSAGYVLAQDFGNNSSASNATYASYEKCKTCHPKEYNDFSQRKFDKSWKILKMRGEDKNAKCLGCHTTGYGKPGGFVSEEKTPALSSKQCESCHGAGSLHVANPGDAAVREQLKVANKKNVCIECHLCMTTHRSVEF